MPKLDYTLTMPTMSDEMPESISKFDLNYKCTVHTAIECLPLPAIADGVISYAPDMMANYDLGTVATYSCSPGFVLDLSAGGSVTRTCMDDGDGDAFGEFDGTAPTCIRKSGTQLFMIELSTVDIQTWVQSFVRKSMHESVLIKGACTKHPFIEHYTIKQFLRLPD